MRWSAARRKTGLTQAEAARLLSISQPYLSQIERGSREAGSELAQKAAGLYRVPSVVRLPQAKKFQEPTPDELQRELAALGYPGFAHLAAGLLENPALVVLGGLVKEDLDARLVEALPWVVSNYVDMDWDYLRDQAKLRNAQNRLGYVVHLAKCVVAANPVNEATLGTLERWEAELEDCRLAKEGTLCRESMPDRERMWVREHRSPAAAHWNLLTGLTAEQLSYGR